MTLSPAPMKSGMQPRQTTSCPPPPPQLPSPSLCVTLSYKYTLQVQGMQVATVPVTGCHAVNKHAALTTPKATIPQFPTETLV
jgi:hypothetical protein